jgi:hypothetical protein
MLKIGIDKTDRDFRHFEYDDDKKYGNPQVYKVLYEESGDCGEVLCSNVIFIKKSNNIHNHFLDIPKYDVKKEDNILETTLDIPKYDDVKKEDNILETVLDIPKYDVKKEDVVSKSELTSDVKEKSVELVKPLEEKKKTKSSKTKTTVKVTTSKSDIVKTEDKKPSIEYVNISTPVVPKSYEYDIIVIDNVSYIEDIRDKINVVKDKLNELGKEGWEVCGFQTVQKVFACQIVIIIKRGLN